MTSLRRRLRRVVWVLVLGLFSEWFIADRMIGFVDESEMASRLQHDADSLAAAISMRPGQGATVDLSRVASIYVRPGSGHYFVLSSPDAVLASPSFGAARPFRLASHTAESVTHVDGPFGQPLLVLTRRLPQRDGTPVDMAVGEDLSELRLQLLEFRLVFLAASVVILLAAAMLQRREIGRAVQSVEHARDAILRLPKGIVPVASVDAPDEIRPLLTEIDRLMGFVDRRLHESRTAVGNLSHALKTPLAGLLRLAEDPLLDDHAALRRALLEQIEAIRLRIERELRRARLAGDRRSGPGFEAGAELPALVQMLTRIHRDKTLDIRWEAPATVLPFDREDMLEMIGNLADNACKWAASRVRITIEQADGLRLSVADDGPGCSPEMLDVLGARGMRVDEMQPGHGLGLAIVRDIADAAGGSLQFRRSPSLGGLEAVVRLPR